jgi:hypothetical protein
MNNFQSISLYVKQCIIFNLLQTPLDQEINIAQNCFFFAYIKINLFMVKSLFLSWYFGYYDIYKLHENQMTKQYPK